MNPPQPAPNPYSEGDRVRVYLSESDPDAEYHGTECFVVDRFKDDLHNETDRKTDQYIYRVKTRLTGRVLPVDFRHMDLVPFD